LNLHAKYDKISYCIYHGKNARRFHMRLSSAHILTLIAAFFSVFWTYPANAMWTADGESVVTFLRPDVVGRLGVVSDGAGGSITCWVDARNGGWDIYAQRVDASGNHMWTVNGIEVAPGSSKVTIIPDGAGGAVIIWNQSHAQRIDADGNLLWPAEGIEIFSGIEDPSDLKAIPDGFNGMLLSWLDGRNGNADIYAQRFSPGGVPLWTTGGVAVCTEGTDQERHEIVTDGEGGMIVGWDDERDEIINNHDIFAQRVDSSGTVLWAASGVVVCSDTMWQGNIEMIPDNAGGAVLAWIEDRDGHVGGPDPDRDVYAQRVSSIGTKMWTTNGVSVCGSLAFAYDLKMTTDGGQGAILVWRNDTGIDDEIYAQRVHTIGTVWWTAGGIEVYGGVDELVVFRVDSDGAGGAMVSLEQDRSGHRDIFCQRVNPSGALLWTAGGVTVCDALQDQRYFRTVSDGVGGIILCWIDERTSYDEVYTQRLDGTGSNVWADDGTPLAKVDFDLSPISDVVTDGEGGAIFCWSDRRRDDRDLYAQRVDSLGNVLWDIEGVPVCFKLGDQYRSRAVSDGAGGAIIVWMDERDGNGDIYAQRLDPSGDPLWALDGLVLCNDAAEEIGPELVQDGSGGAIIAWYDDRNGNYDVFSQRIDASGNKLWGTGDIAVCVAAYDQLECRIVTDGAGGAVIGWNDNRSWNRDIYAQKLNSSGAVQWITDGIPLCTVSYYKEQMEMAPDGSGGALMVWRDDRTGYDNVYIRKIDSSGNPLWTADGIRLIDIYTVGQYLPKVVSDGAGGAVAVWEDYRAGSGSVYCQHVDSAGVRTWHPDGRSVYSSSMPQEEIEVVSDGAGGVVIAWADFRNTVDTDIYAMRIGPSGDFEWLVPSDGIPVCTAAGHQRWPKLVSDGFWGAIMVWIDRRHVEGFEEFYAQLIKGAIGSVEPTSLDFGIVPILSNRNKSFTVTNIGDLTLSEEIELTNMLYYSTLGYITEYSIDPGANQLIQVRFEPEYETVETCVIDLGSAAMSDVSCTGTGLGPICEIDTVDIDIPGMVMVGDSYDTTFTITNAGGGILNGYVSEIDDHFNLPYGETPFSIYRYDTLEVTVRFKPTAEGTHICTVDLGAYLCADVTVTGTAFLCPPDSVLYVDADAWGAGTGASWADAFTDLQDALARANLCASVTEIWVAEGTYYASKVDDVYESFTLKNDLRIYGGFDGTESTLGSRAMLVSTTVLSGDLGIPGDIGDNTLHVVIGSYTDSTAVLDGFTITRGHALLPGHQEGGGMYMTGGSPILRNLVFSRNRARLMGGGLYARNLSNAMLYNCVFFGNAASNFGGGIYNDASSPLIANCTFCRNKVDDSGAAVFNENNSNPTIVNTIMWEDSTNSMSAPEIANHNYSYPVISYSLLQYCGDSGGGWETSYGIDGGNNTERDADFIDMATGDLHLFKDSYALDAGDPTVPGLPSTDIDGNPRIIGIEIDMGAYEGEYEKIRVSLETVPDHLEVTLDGDTFVTPYSFDSRSGAIHEIGTHSPQVQGDIIYSYAAWSDAGDTVHTVLLPELESTTYTATFSWAYAYASIDSIVDVPNDQGGWVRVHCRRSHYDDAGEATYPIERYDMHRRVDSPALLASVLMEGKRTEEGYIEYGGRLFVVLEEPEALSGDGLKAPAAAPPGVWEVVGTISAAQQENYIGLAPTLADSTATIPYSVYYIAAHSTSPAVFFDSPADSGYSVDNIAPGVPLGMAVAYNTGIGNELTWDASPEPDFQFYRVYRGDSEDFTPGPGNLVHETATEGWNDPEYDGWDVHYKITALDYAGNESDAASPGSTTGDEVPLIPMVFALYQNVPNPFNPTTTISFDLPRAVHVKLCIYNVKGELIATLVNQHMMEGRKEITWSAKDNRGCSVSSGIYFYRFVAGNFMQTRKMVLLR
jgi:hypothetical protein